MTQPQLYSWKERVLQFLKALFQFIVFSVGLSIPLTLLLQYVLWMEFWPLFIAGVIYIGLTILISDVMLRKGVNLG